MVFGGGRAIGWKLIKYVLKMSFTVSNRISTFLRYIRQIQSRQWAYFRVGLLSVGFSFLKFGGPTIRWAYLWDFKSFIPTASTQAQK